MAAGLTSPQQSTDLLQHDYDGIYDGDIYRDGY